MLTFGMTFSTWTIHDRGYCNFLYGDALTPEEVLVLNEILLQQSFLGIFTELRWEKWDFQTEPSAAGARGVVRNVWVPTIPKPSADRRS